MKRLILPLIFLAAPAQAATFIPPTGCTTYLTVQSRECMVSQFYTCEGDAKGEQWRADFDAEGPAFMAKVDHDAQWLESHYAYDGTKDVLAPMPRDPASFSDLLALGLDTFDFKLSNDNGEQTTIRGFDKLTGETTTIDGVTLKQTEFEYTQTDDKGTVLVHSKGREYISEEWRAFFSNHSESEFADGENRISDMPPVKFITPGKPGFALTLPLFECDAQMSSLGLPHSVAKSLGGS